MCIRDRSHRVVVAESTQMARRSLLDLELPVLSGMRILALRGGNGWTTNVTGETILVPGDVLFLEGPPGGIPTVRELAGAPPREAVADTEPIEELDRAIDILVEMKNLSEAAVGLRTLRSCWATAA